MTLSHDWQVRIDSWLEAVRARVMTPLRDVPAGFCPTMGHLSPDEALRLPFKPARAGMRWGRKWEYGWFRSRVRVPKAPPGKAVVLTLAAGRPGVESTVFVDGVAAGGLDSWHDHIDLSAAARPGRRVEVLIETYAGHGPTPCSRPFVLPGRADPDVPSRQLRFGGIRLQLWNEQAYQLWMDAATAGGLSRCVQADSLRQVKLGQGLQDVSCVVDPESPPAEFDASLAAGRKVLAPLLAARNGTTAPEMHVFGHSHIDVAWLWPLAQTYRKNAHTFSSMLALMRRYPEFRFLQSQAQLYDFLRAQYPQIYARIKRAARKGQWIADGGMWVEADTNVSGGEALIRQFLYGKRFFKDEFGVESDLCWLPDVFGYSGSLPQILRGCGI
ncbi:MAG: glycoside hydrolase family 38 N-terminal domain-containing protein, partial [Planctomycetota bacterium]